MKDSSSMKCVGCKKSIQKIFALGAGYCDDCYKKKSERCIKSIEEINNAFITQKFDNLEKRIEKLELRGKKCPNTHKQISEK